MPFADAKFRGRELADHSKLLIGLPGQSVWPPQNSQEKYEIGYQRDKDKMSYLALTAND